MVSTEVGACIECGTVVFGKTCPECGGLVVFGGWEEGVGPEDLVPEEGWDQCVLHGVDQIFKKCRLTITDKVVTVSRGREIIERWEREEITALDVDDAAGVRQRITATRVILFGGLGLLAPKTTRIAFVTIQTSSSVVVVEIPGISPPAVRAHLANTFGGAALPVGPEPLTDELARSLPESPVNHTVEDRLRTLARLHVDGLVTDAEFAAKRAELIDLL